MDHDFRVPTQAVSHAVLDRPRLHFLAGWIRGNPANEVTDLALSALEMCAPSPGTPMSSSGKLVDSRRIPVRLVVDPECAIVDPDPACRGRIGRETPVDAVVWAVPRWPRIESAESKPSRGGPARPSSSELAAPDPGGSVRVNRVVVIALGAERIGCPWIGQGTSRSRWNWRIRVHNTQTGSVSFSGLNVKMNCAPRL